MAEQLVIRIDELRSAMSRALLEAEQQLGSEVVVADDYYWHLPVDMAFDMTKEPSSLTTGQLSDDVEHLRGATDLEPLSVWHHLAHLVGLLRAVERLATP